MIETQTNNWFLLLGDECTYILRKKKQEKKTRKAVCGLESVYFSSRHDLEGAYFNRSISIP